MSITDVAANRVNRPAPPTIQERFEAYHAENPEVYDYFVEFARKAKAAGFETYSLRIILERVRWHVNVEVKKDDAGFKINNDFAPRYARRIMKQEPDLAGFFHIRHLERL